MVNRDINALTPETRRLCLAALALWSEAGLNVFVTETLRSPERQAELWAMGRTKAGRKVTFAQHSKHQDGLAFDVAFRGGNLYPNDAALWARLGSIGESVGLTWGGRFRGVDSPHFQSVKE